MKKILYTIGFLMIMSAVIQPLNALGQEQFSGKEEDLPYSSARLFSKLVEKTGLNPSANWAESFGTDKDEDVGKDLYLMVYDKVQNQPIKQTNRNVAGKYGIPEADLIRFLHGDYTKLVESRPGISQKDALEKIAEIQQVYMEEKELQALESEIKAATEPSEIFANGEVSDSGFDLINDLRIIEYLLFLKSNPSGIGASYTGGRGGTGSVGGGSGNQTSSGSEDAGTPSVVPQTTPATSGSSGSQQNPEAQETTGTPISGATATSTGTSETSTGTQTGSVSGPATGEEERLNPNACFSDDRFTDALDDFLENAQSNDDYKDNAATGASDASSGTVGSGGTATGTTADAGAASSGGASSGTGSTGRTGLANTAASVQQPFVYAEAAAAPAQSAPKDNWLKDKICLKTFCLTVNMVMKPATSAFQDSDNCIACHAEKINAVLKNVISHSLVPAKAPGNLGEPGVCKKALSASFGSISMNIYTLAMPVITPMNDDLVYGNTIERDWYNYCNAVAFPFSCRQEDLPKNVEEAGYEIPRSVLDMVSKRELAMSADGVQQSVVTNNISTAVTGYELERYEGLQTYSMSKGAGNSVLFYQAIIFSATSGICFTVCMRRLTG